LSFFDIDFIRGPIFQRLMKPLHIVEDEIPGEPFTGLCNRTILMQIYLLVSDRSPETLHENIVINPPSPVHADPDIGGFKRLDEILAGELRSLVGVENIGL
jgi:hypothetical protein